MKQLVLDMDGTFVDLYGVKDWLYDLEHNSTKPYEIAAPLCDILSFNELLNILKTIGYKIIIVSWTAKNGDKAYNKAIRKAKINWLKKYNVPVDEIHVVKYGTPKSYLVQGEAILIDDEELNRNTWLRGKAIDPQHNICEELVNLIEEVA